MEEPGATKIEALRRLVAGLPAASTYAFSSGTERIDASRIPDPGGSTNLAGAFDRIKQDGWRSAILITDGAPDDADAALASAAGLALEIFYVGPKPKPHFLDRLAKACGGQARIGDMSRMGAAQLQVQIRGLLGQ